MPAPLASQGFVPRSAPRPVTRRGDQSAVYVASDWPDDLPIREAELRAVEAWLGDILDDFWGPIP